MQSLVTVLHRAKTMYFLCCRCSGEYVGEYCQNKNPCNNGEQKCQNGGTCTVLYSPTQAPTFKVCLFLCFYFLEIWVGFIASGSKLFGKSWSRIRTWIQFQFFFINKLEWSLLSRLIMSDLVKKNSVYFFLCLHEWLSIWRSLECWPAVDKDLTVRASADQL
jgi:hypothetical protein